MARKDIELQEHLLFYGSLLLLIGLCLVEATVVGEFVFFLNSSIHFFSKLKYNIRTCT